MSALDTIVFPNICCFIWQVRAWTWYLHCSWVICYLISYINYLITTKTVLGELTFYIYIAWLLNKKRNISSQCYFSFTIHFKHLRDRTSSSISSLEQVDHVQLTGSPLYGWHDMGLKHLSAVKEVSTTAPLSCRPTFSTGYWWMLWKLNRKHPMSLDGTWGLTTVRRTWPGNTSNPKMFLFPFILTFSIISIDTVIQ